MRMQKPPESFSMIILSSNHMKKYLKYIYVSLLTGGLLGSVLALFIVFCILLPDIQVLVIPHKNDELVAETIHKWETISVITAAVAGGILALSIVGWWFDIKKWWEEESNANPRLARKRLAKIIVILIVIIVGALISFIIGDRSL